MPGVKMEQLKLSTLIVVDPRIEVLFQKQITRVAQDCLDRPLDAKERKVILEFQVKPQIDPETGDCDSVDVSIASEVKTPPYKTKAFPMRPTKAGLVFNAEVPDDLNQRGLEFEDVENDERER